MNIRAELTISFYLFIGKTLINEELIFPENIFYVLFLWLGDDHGPVVIGDCSSFTALLITM